MQKQQSPSDIALEAGHADVAALLNRHALAHLAAAAGPRDSARSADTSSAADNSTLVNQVADVCACA